jgi:hypothetical protein
MLTPFNRATARSCLLVIFTSLIFSPSFPPAGESGQAGDGFAFSWTQPGCPG